MADPVDPKCNHRRQICLTSSPILTRKAIKMRTNLPVTSREVQISEHHRIVSKTDLKGQITYINKDFIEISGFSEIELLGQPHNIVRHPDMPEEAFADFWRNLKDGRPWVGLVKNRCKNGDYYWVEAHASPVWEDGQITGYLSVRRKASQAAIDAAAKGYQAFRDKKASGQAIVHGQIVSGSPWARARRRLADLPISLRFLLPSVALLVAVMVATVTFIGHQITQTLGASGEQELKQQVQLVHAMMASTFDAVERESSRLLDIYAARYPGTFTLCSAPQQDRGQWPVR